MSIRVQSGSNNYSAVVEAMVLMVLEWVAVALEWTEW